MVRLSDLQNLFGNLFSTMYMKGFGISGLNTVLKMIKILHDFTSDKESNQMVNFFKSNKDLSKLYNVEGDSYYCVSMSILNYLEVFQLFKRFKIDKNQFARRLNIQLIDENLKVLEKHHTHIAPFSFVLFLNDDFDGGELVFDNITIKPKKNMVVYFSGNLGHHVKPVYKGERYTLVGFTYSEIHFEKYLKRNTL